jgi:thymidylate synthase (FAD)
LNLVRDILAGKATIADADRYGLSKREARELAETLGLTG